MIDRLDCDFSMRRQYGLLGINRSKLYYRRLGESWPDEAARRAIYTYALLWCTQDGGIFAQPVAKGEPLAGRGCYVQWAWRRSIRSLISSKPNPEH